MEKVEPEELFKQIRSAHRMVVAYYKRLFPILDQVATELELQFYRWQSVGFDHPAQKGTDIVCGKKWEWDLLPALNASYLYYNAKDANTQMKGDWLLEFRVLTDTGVLDEEGNKNRIGNQDPLELSMSVEDAESKLEVYLFSPTKEGSLNWYSGVWSESEYPSVEDSPSRQCVCDTVGIYADAFSFPLEKLVDEDIVDVLVDRIKKSRDGLFEQAFSLQSS